MIFSYNNKNKGLSEQSESPFCYTFIKVSESEHLLVAEIEELRHHNGNAQQDHKEVAIFPLEHEHIGEIHAEPSGDEGQRHEDGGDDGKEGHDLVLLDLNLGLVQFPDL